MLMETFVSSVSISIMSGRCLILLVFHTPVNWRTVKDVRPILKNVKNACRTPSATFPAEDA